MFMKGKSKNCQSSCTKCRTEEYIMYKISLRCKNVK